MKVPTEKIRTYQKLLLFARELEVQGFASFTIKLAESDGSNWMVTDEYNQQPRVEYVGKKETLSPLTHTTPKKEVK